MNGVIAGSPKAPGAVGSIPSGRLAQQPYPNTGSLGDNRLLALPTSCLISQGSSNYIENNNNPLQSSVAVHGPSLRNLQGGNVGLVTEAVWGKAEGTVCDCGHIDGIGAQR